MTSWIFTALASGNNRRNTSLTTTWDDVNEIIQSTIPPARNYDIVNKVYSDTFFYGLGISATPPTDGQVPVWVDGDGTWEFQTLSGGGGITDIENVGFGNSLVTNAGSSSPINIASIMDDSGTDQSTIITTPDSGLTWQIAANFNNPIWNAASLCSVPLFFGSVGSPADGDVITYDSGNGSYKARALPNPLPIKYQINDTDGSNSIITQIGTSDETTTIDASTGNIYINTGTGEFFQATVDSDIRFFSNAGGIFFQPGSGSSNFEVDLQTGGNFVVSSIPQNSTPNMICYNTGTSVFSYSMRPGILAFSNATGSISASTAATTLQTLTVPSNTLTAAGKSVTFKMNGILASTASNLTIAFRLGAGTIFTVPTATLIASASSAWSASLTINYTGSTSYSYEASFKVCSSTALSTIEFYTGGVGTGVTMSSSIALSITAATGVGATLSYAAGTTLTLLT